MLDLAEDDFRKTRLSQRFFNPLSLSFYDFLLFKIISPYFWGLKTASLIERHTLLCRTKHLEVGVGTGYLLDRASPSLKQLGLLDLNHNCLQKTQRRLGHYTPTLWRKNILQTLNGVDAKFDSIAINYVMHCVAGTYDRKGIVFGNLKPLLNENGILFGATVLKTESTGPLAKMLMALFNWLGVFNNKEDTPAAFETSLTRHFRYTSIVYRNSCALFVATDSETQFRTVLSNHTSAGEENKQNGSLVALHMRESFARLSPLLQRAHTGKIRLIGSAQVKRDRHIANALCSLFKLPYAGDRVHLRVDCYHNRDSMLWIRRFNTREMRSHFSSEGDFLVEHLGPLKLYFTLTEARGKLHYLFTRTRLLGVTLPRFLSPKITAEEYALNDQYYFSVTVFIFLIGHVISYEGKLSLQDIPNVPEI